MQPRRSGMENFYVAGRRAYSLNFLVFPIGQFEILSDKIILFCRGKQKIAT